MPLTMSNLYDFTATDIDGQDQPLSTFKGKAVVIVNVASKCGFTPHYQGLQELYEAYKDKGVEILGFPCNQFGAQEPGTEAEIKQFCSLTYGVSFPMFSKVDVNGDGRHPLFAWLTEQAAAPEGPGDISWNFTKFIVGPDGSVAGRFGPRTAPGELAEPLDRILS